MAICDGDGVATVMVMAMAMVILAVLAKYKSRTATQVRVYEMGGRYQMRDSNKKEKEDQQQIYSTLCPPFFFPACSAKWNDAT